MLINIQFNIIGRGKLASSIWLKSMVIFQNKKNLQIIDIHREILIWTSGIPWEIINFIKNGEWPNRRFTRFLIFGVYRSMFTGRRETQI